MGKLTIISDNRKIYIKYKIIPINSWNKEKMLSSHFVLMFHTFWLELQMNGGKVCSLLLPTVTLQDVQLWVSGPHFENLHFKTTNGPITNSLLSNASYLLLQDCEIMTESVTRLIHLSLCHLSMWHKTRAYTTLAATWWPENIKYIRLADHQLL